MVFLDILIKIVFVNTVKTIVLKSGAAWLVDSGPGRPGAGTRPSWRKNRGRKNLVWPGWPGGLTQQPGWPGQKLSCNSLIFVLFFFLQKRRHFYFKKKLIRTIQATRSKPGTWTLDRAGYKNYG